MAATSDAVSVHRSTLAEVDPEVFELIQLEIRRQEGNLELIASENIASLAVREAMMSVLTDKYAEGYPGKRYYGGCDVVDEVENLAIERAKELLARSTSTFSPIAALKPTWRPILASSNPATR